MENEGVAAGLAAYALTMELINSLVQSRMIRRNDVVTIIDLALVGLERTADGHPNSAPLDRARKMLDWQLRRWQQDRPR